jgi:GNAT superfamily N-acetyltransferase
VIHHPLSIRVRRATEGDLAAVTAFTRATWDGWDYLPDALPGWLAARDGVVLVAEAVDVAELPGASPGQPIAVGRFCVLSETEAWMEGLRVDPIARGRGVATAFQLAQLTWAQAQGASVVRYATGETNEGSLALGAKHGFVEAGRWRALRPVETTPGPVAVDRNRTLELIAREGLATPSAPAWETLQADPNLNAGGGLYEWRWWAWQQLTAERLQRHARNGAFVSGRAGGTQAFGLVGQERVPGETRLVVLAGSAAAAIELVERVSMATERRPIIRLPDASPLLDGLGPALESAGWRIGEHALVLMARALVDEAGGQRPLPEDGADRLEFAEPPRPLGLEPNE